MPEELAGAEGELEPDADAAPELDASALAVLLNDVNVEGEGDAVGKSELRVESDAQGGVGVTKTLSVCDADDDDTKEADDESEATLGVPELVDCKLKVGKIEGNADDVRVADPSVGDADIAPLKVAAVEGEGGLDGARDKVAAALCVAADRDALIDADALTEGDTDEEAEVTIEADSCAVGVRAADRERLAGTLAVPDALDKGEGLRDGSPDKEARGRDDTALVTETSATVAEEEPEIDVDPEVLVVCDIEGLGRELLDALDTPDRELTRDSEEPSEPLSEGEGLALERALGDGFDEPVAAAVTLSTDAEALAVMTDTVELAEFAGERDTEFDALGLKDAFADDVRDGDRDTEGHSEALGETLKLAADDAEECECDAELLAATDSDPRDLVADGDSPVDRLTALVALRETVAVSDKTPLGDAPAESDAPLDADSLSDGDALCDALAESESLEEAVEDNEA